MYIQAGENISEFQYRKIFGLSKAEMLDEPLDDYFTNSFIQETISAREVQEVKKLENEAKLRKSTKHYG